MFSSSSISLPWDSPLLLLAQNLSEVGPFRGHRCLWEHKVCPLGMGGLKYNQLVLSCPVLGAAWSLSYLA